MKRFNITVNGKAYDVAVEEITGSAPVAAAPAQTAAPAPAPAVAASAPAPAPAPAQAAAGSVKVNSPMPGTILDVKISVGQKVEANQVLVLLEAMKMENDIVAPSAGTVAGIHVNKGDSVDTGALLVSLA